MLIMSLLVVLSCVVQHRVMNSNEFWRRYPFWLFNVVPAEYPTMQGSVLLMNENACVSHLPRVDGVESSPNKFDLDPVTLTYDLDL